MNIGMKWLAGGTHGKWCQKRLQDSNLSGKCGNLRELLISSAKRKRGSGGYASASTPWSSSLPSMVEVYR
jgi:hypothetical protein